MALDLDEMKLRVFAVARDPSRQFVADEMVENWLNEAQEDLAARLKVHTDIETGTFEAQEDEDDISWITHPEDLLEPLHVLVAGETVDLVPGDVFRSYRQPALVLDTPMAVAERSRVAIYPKQAVGVEYSLEYVKSPPELRGPADESELPVELHQKMINYARAHVMWQIGEDTKGDRYMGLYEQGLPAHPLSRLRNKPGPVTVRRSYSNWDTMDGATHI